MNRREQLNRWSSTSISPRNRKLMSNFIKGHFIHDDSRAADIPEHLLEKNQRATPENIALFKSAKVGSMTGVRNALDKGAKPDFFFNPEDSKNALHIAAQEGYLSVVEELLKAGAHVNCLVLGSKDTALTLAAQNKHLEVVQLLIEAGADINIANGYGNTALHEAIREDSEDIANILVDAGADVNCANHKGSTPFHFLCYVEHGHAGTVTGLARKMVHAGADVHAVDHRGMTPFLVCCSTGRMDLIEFLLEEGADPTVRDASGRGAKEIGEFYDHQEVIARFAEDTPVNRFSSLGRK